MVVTVELENTNVCPNLDVSGDPNTTTIQIIAPSPSRGHRPAADREPVNERGFFLLLARLWRYLAKNLGTKSCRPR